jgi:hypothetical protein
MDFPSKRSRAAPGVTAYAGRSLVVTAGFALLLTVLGGNACGGASLEVLGFLDDADAGGHGDADAVPDAEGQDAGPSNYCSGTGAPALFVRLDGGTTVPVCPATLAQSAFRYALCMCDGMVSGAPITTDSFDSAQGGYDAARARAGGGLGANGNINAVGTVAIGGAFWASDVTGVTLRHATIAGELHAAGRVASGPLLHVGGDAFVLGDIAADGDLTIGGTLHQPPGATATVGGVRSVAMTEVASFSVPAACDCDPALFVDVAGFVEGFRADNDNAASANDADASGDAASASDADANDADASDAGASDAGASGDAAIGIDPRALENVGDELTISIPCGRIFFTSIGTRAPLHVRLAAGRTAIFIGGDVAVGGALTVEGNPDSEVDLFVEGNVLVGGAFALGSAASPRKARLWVGGGGTVQLSGAAEIAGNIYAPHAELVLGAAPTTIFGSVFARRLSAPADLTVHYDESVLTPTDTCSSAPSRCTSCHDCANQACFAGTCGACTESTQCCSPLVCSGGRCVPSK